MIHFQIVFLILDDSPSRDDNDINLQYVGKSRVISKLYVLKKSTTNMKMLPAPLQHEMDIS